MRIALALASASLILSASAAETKGEPKLQPNCDGGCEVLITMSAGCGSGIKVAPDPIVVSVGKGGDIHWKVVTDAWAFDAGGIVLHNNNSEDAFDKPSTSDKKLVKIKNKARKPGTIKYDVILKGGPDNRQCKLDPTVVNQ